MIIKSLSRKSLSFDQLVNYMLAEDGAKALLRHNLPVKTKSPEQIIAAFEENHSYLPKRANGNALFHEIIALEPNLEATVKDQKKALAKIAERYLELRAPNQLAFGVVHTSTAHVHLHLVISSNAVFSKKREWLKKKEFAEIQREIEAYQLQHFPELGDAQHYAQGRDGIKRKEREQAATLRTGKLSQKEQVTEAVAAILHEAKNRQSLNAELEKAGLNLYQRSRSVGVQTQGGRKYRLSTLGLTSDYAEAMARIELVESRISEFNKGMPSHSRSIEYEL